MWLPFASRGDFECSDLVLDAALNENQVNKLLKLINRLKNGEETLTFTNYTQVKDRWARAAYNVTPVSHDHVGA